MATYTNQAFNYPPRFPRGFEWLACDEPTRVYANGDIVKGPKVDKGNKVVGAIFAARAELDTNAGATATGKVRLNHATLTPVNLIDITAAHLGTANGIVVHLNVPAGFNKVIEEEGWWVELVFDAAFATAATGEVAFGVGVSSNLYGDEQRLVES